MEADSFDREEALLDLRFYLGQQWDDGTYNERFNAGRPALTINRIRPIVLMVSNEFRQQRPSIQVLPVGSGADIQTAEIEEGIVRHIENLSDAEIAYDFANEMMVACGRGSFRFITEYSDDIDEDGKPYTYQEIRAKKIPNPFSVYWDPDAVDPNKEDALYCFITEDYDREEFKLQYPNASLTSLSGFRATGDEQLWFPEGQKIRLAEYFEVSTTQKTLCLLTDGRREWKDELLPGDEAMIKATRPVHNRIVKWYKMSGAEVLEEAEIPGEYIPVVTMIGGEYIVQDKRISMGLVRGMRDAQRMYNIARSGAVECVLLAPRAPWVVWEGQTENHEMEWKWANIRNMPYLTVRPVAGPDGSLLPPPTRNTWEAPIMSMTQLMGQADNDIKASSGIYDASLGNKNDQDRSGKAIEALQQQGSTATYSFSDNSARSIRHAGRIIVSMIPKVYDTERVIRIMKPDKQVEMMPINQHFKTVAGKDGVMEHQILEAEIPGISKIYDLSVGKYDVTAQMGPAFETKRQEAFKLLVDLAKAFPQIMQVAGDIIASNWDAPFAQDLAKRLKVLLPPAIQQMEAQGAGQQAISPIVVAQQQAMIQQLQMQLQQLVQVLREKKIEADGKQKIALMNAIAGIIEAEIKAGSASADNLAKMNMDAVGRMVDLIMQNAQADQQDQAAAGEGGPGSQGPQMSGPAMTPGGPGLPSAAPGSPASLPGAIPPGTGPGPGAPMPVG